MESGRKAMGEMGRLLCGEGRKSGERPAKAKYHREAEKEPTVRACLLRGVAAARQPA